MTCLSKRARAVEGDARGWAKRARASAGDEAKLRFMQSALDLDREGFARKSSAEDDVRAAAEWAASTPAEEARPPPAFFAPDWRVRALRAIQVIVFREAAVTRFER